MTPERCPNCGTKLAAETSACPNCPLSFPEDDPASEVHPLRQSRYYKLLAPALFLAGLGWGIWLIGNGLFHLAEENSRIEDSPALRGLGIPSGKPAGPGPAQTTTIVPRPASPAAAETQEDEGEIVIVADGTAARAPAAKKAASPWRLQGTVYDLTSLRPLAGCVVVFIDQRDNLRFAAQTDAAGRYQTTLSPLSGRGYAVAIQKDGYASSYLDPATKGVREMSSWRRRKLAREAASSLSAAAVLQAQGEEPLVTDFYLAPR